MPENQRTKDFRHVFSNTFNMQFSDNDVRLTFGHQLDVSDAAKGIVEEVSVFMTPRSAKIMMLVLKIAIERFEQSAGAPIPLPPEKMEEIEKSLTKSIVGHAAKSST